MSVLVNPFRFVSSPPVVTFRSSTSNASAASTYTFTAQAIGPAAADRYVYVATSGRIAGTIPSFAVSSLTVGGISAAELVVVNGTANNTGSSSIWRALVPTGTTADIVVNYTGGSSVRCGIVVWSGTGSSTVYATSTAGAGGTPGATLSLNVAANGAVLATGTSTSSDAHAWSGLTENADYQIGSAQHRVSGASASSLSAATPRAISFTYGGATNFYGVAVSLS